MKSVTLNEIKKELNYLESTRVAELCLRLAKYKKENKELLSYLLFEVHDEAAYIEKVKIEIDEQFENIPQTNIYLAKKTLRKILRITNKFIKYSGSKQTEVELLIYYCKKLNTSGIAYHNYTILNNMYTQITLKITKAISLLHEDLQYDYDRELEELGK